MYRCSARQYLLKLGLLLKDRPYKDELQRMEDALAYTLEIIVSLCVYVLKDFIGVWKCDEGNAFRNL